MYRNHLMKYRNLYFLSNYNFLYHGCLTMLYNAFAYIRYTYVPRYPLFIRSKNSSHTLFFICHIYYLESCFLSAFKLIVKLFFYHYMIFIFILFILYIISCTFQYLNITNAGIILLIMYYNNVL